MRELRAEEAATLLQVTLPALKNEHRITRRVMEAIPAGREEYRPDANAMSARDLAWHIASAENMFFGAVARGEFDFSRNERPESIRTAAEILDWYVETFHENFERLRELTGEELAKVVDFRGKFQLPAVIYLESGLRHSVHHRGQLSVYLRSMGGKVPSIYGESYDDRQARLAAEAAS